MNRWFVALFVLTACSSAKPPAVDPATDPTVVGAVDEAARQGTAEGAEAAHAARGVARAAGVLAAVFGGPERESVDDVVDRYRRTRDAVEATSAVIGAAHGAKEGAKRGYQFDLQFAELRQIEGLEVVRPFPDQIDVRFAAGADRAVLAKVAAVFAGREERAIDIRGAGDAALEMRESLIELGVPSSSLAAHRDDQLRDVVLRVRYRD